MVVAESVGKQPARTPRKRGVYGVRLTRGPFVRLAPNARAVDDEAQLAGLVERLRTENPGGLLAADLFSGAGGLSLGLEQAGVTTVFAVDHDREAVETHRHHFPGMTVDWDLSDPAVVDRVARIVQTNRIDILAGGPPCQPFSKAGRSLIRHMVRNGQRDQHDRRRDLWRSFMEVIRVAMPRAVIMENVPDMALDREMFILRTMVLELEQLGYGVEERVVETWRYGVPQFRQRLILVALRGGLQFTWPSEVARKTTVDNAISDLPEVEGGWRPEGGAEGWADYVGPGTRFQEQMRSGVSEQDAGRIYDHITRPVRDDDRRIFELMDSDTRYSELPDELKRYRDDIFDDKYKRLDPNNLSRTITAHIAKDGYWYIHPYQGRTITIREAARLQTFPDAFRFAGPPSASFRQIGNAVPPMLGRVLGEAVLKALDEEQVDAYTSEQISVALARWFDDAELLVTPWLNASTRWQVISAELLLERSVTDHVRHIWPVIRRLTTPGETLAAAEDLREIGKLIGREARVERVLELAGSVSAGEAFPDELLEELKASKRVPESVADFAALVVAVGGEDESEQPVIVTKGVLRVAARFTGEDVDRRNRLSDGRMAVARMIGYGEQSRRAHLALMELSSTACRPVDPECTVCPIALWCKADRTIELVETRLPIEI